MKGKVLSLIVMFWSFYGMAYANDYTAASPVTASTVQAAILTAYNNRANGPHNVIIPNDTYNNFGLVTVSSGYDASSGKEITIRPATLGGVTFTGASGFKIIGQYWVVKGFIWDSFTTGLEVNVMNHVKAPHVRITENEFRNSNLGVDYYPIRLCATDAGWCGGTDASYAEIDHNYFHDMTNPHAVSLTYTYYAHVHHNYFKNFPWGGGNNFVIGAGSDTGHMDLDTRHIVEYNIIDNWHGDYETIMDKTSSNIYRYNVFLNLGGSDGKPVAISCRLGEDTIIFNNWWFALDTISYMRGLRLSDKGHKVIGNYFYGNIYSYGIIMTGFQTGNDFWDVQNALIDFNTFIITNSSAEAIVIGDSDIDPSNNTISNNILIGTGALMEDLSNGGCSSFSYAKNLLYSSTGGSWLTGNGCDSGWPSLSGTDIHALNESEYNALYGSPITINGWSNLYPMTQTNHAQSNSAKNTNTYGYDSSVNAGLDHYGRTRANPTYTGAEIYSTAARLVEPPPIGCSVPTWHSLYTCDTQPPPKISDASPSQGATQVNISTNLTWTNPVGAITVDVYFDEDEVSCPPGSPTQVSTGSLVSSYNPPGDLGKEKKCCWRVDVVHSGGTATGDNYEFTTAEGPPAPIGLGVEIQLK